MPFHPLAFHCFFATATHAGDQNGQAAYVAYAGAGGVGAMDQYLRDVGLISRGVVTLPTGSIDWMHTPLGRRFARLERLRHGGAMCVAVRVLPRVDD